MIYYFINLFHKALYEFNSFRNLGLSDVFIKKMFFFKLRNNMGINRKDIETSFSIFNCVWRVHIVRQSNTD